MVINFFFGFLGNIVGQQNFGWKNFWIKKIFQLKIFWVLKIFWSKKFRSKKFLDQKKFWSKRFGSEFFLSKITGRVNPRGRIYDSSPQKIVGLKVCWVVLSYPKRFFVKKKILVELTLVGEGLMTPPPENSRVKIVLGCC